MKLPFSALKGLVSPPKGFRTGEMGNPPPEPSQGVTEAPVALRAQLVMLQQKANANQEREQEEKQVQLRADFEELWPAIEARIIEIAREHAALGVSSAPIRTQELGLHSRYHRALREKLAEWAALQRLTFSNVTVEPGSVGRLSWS